MSPDQIRELADGLRAFARFANDRAEGDDDNSFMAFSADGWAEKMRRYADDLEAEELAR